MQQDKQIRIKCKFAFNLHLSAFKCIYSAFIVNLFCSWSWFYCQNLMCWLPQWWPSLLGWTRRTRSHHPRSSDDDDPWWCSHQPSGKSQARPLQGNEVHSKQTKQTGNNNDHLEKPVEAGEWKQPRAGLPSNACNNTACQERGEVRWVDECWGLGNCHLHLRHEAAHLFDAKLRAQTI